MHYTAISAVQLGGAVTQVFAKTANKIYAINKNLLQHRQASRKSKTPNVHVTEQRGT